MFRAILVGLALLVAVIVVFAILVPVLHIAFLFLVVAAIAFVAFRVGRRASRRRSRDPAGSLRPGPRERR
jgi:membrane protein implicated in regulation of membrane protease activity